MEAGTTLIHQHKYILDMVDRFGQRDAAAINLPYSGGDETQPEGHADPDRLDYVSKLLKSLYGLKQSAHLWNQLLNKTLIKLGYKHMLTNPSCFIKVD